MLASVTPAQTLNGFDLKDSLVPPDQILPGGPGRDGIPAIDAPKFVPASAANLAAADRVLGLARNSVVKAYPVKILNWHEIVNDRFHDEPIAVTYCPLCGTGIAYLARAGAARDVRRLGLPTTATCPLRPARSHSGRRLRRRRLPAPGREAHASR
jgi:hypothetical protein